MIGSLVFRRWKCMVLLLGLLALFQVPGWGGEPIPLQEVWRDTNGDRLPDLLNQTVTVEGMLISEPQVERGGRISTAHLQDAEAGVLLRAEGSGLVTENLDPGDIVQVTGTLVRQEGTVWIQVGQIRSLAQGNVPLPRKVTAAELNSGKNSGQLVRVRGRLQIPSDSTGGEDDLILADPSGAILVGMESRFYRNFDFYERLKQAREVEVVGISHRRISSSGSNARYQVRPRDSGDFYFVPPFPYRAIGLGFSAAFLLGAFSYLVARRRSAERRAQQLTLLSEKLQKSEAALGDSNQRLSELINASPLGIISSDPAGNLQMVNAAAERMFGWREPEVLGKPLPYIPEDKHDEYQALRAAKHQGKGVYGLEVRRQRKDGSLIDVSLSTALLLDGQGRLVGSMAMYADVTARKQAEEALRQSNQRLSTLLRSCPLAVIALDREGNVETWNPEAERMYGWSEQEVLGKPLPPIPAAEGTYQGTVDRLFRGEVIQAEERVSRRKDGSQFPISLSVSPVYDADGRISGSIAIIQDTSDYKQLQAQLLHSQKMEAVGRLAGGVAHDFNNLMEVIGGYGELLLLRVQEDATLRHFGEEIQKAIQRAASLTRQLLAFSRKQVLQPEVLDLNAVVLNMDKLLQRLIGEDIQLATVLQPDLGRVKADSGQIEQVIANLAVNARDAMPRGGELRIETANVDRDGTAGRDGSDLPPGPYVCLAVSDTGVGMDAETRAHLFEPFFTTKPLGQGTGLGLATVYGIVEQSGGHISVSSEPGHGTTFQIYLPRWEGPLEAPGPVSSAAAMEEGSETILVVEDEPAVRELARVFLELSGYHVLDSSCGPEALQLAQQYSGPIHLVLTDVIMPGMSGRELADRIVVLRPESRILYMSGYTGDALASHGVVDSGRSFLQKPFTRAALAQKVRELLGEPRSPELPTLGS